MQQRSLKRLQWSTFLSATLGYGMYYVCRLSLNVVKKPIVEEGIFSETELGIIGAVLFFTYAVGKFTNGFLADRSNINRFMSTGLLVTALVNLFLGFVHSFILFAILWGISGWFQSMGAASCVVGLSRWFTDKERGSFYGFWSASHNIGEAMTFIIVASVVSAFGWRYGFLGAGLVVPHEQHRNSEQGQRASRAAPHGRRADSRDREHSGRDQGAHDRHRRRHADGCGLQDHLEDRDEQPVRQHGVQESHAGIGRALHQVHHKPPLCCGVKEDSGRDFPPAHRTGL